MTSPREACASCGAEIDLASGGCPVCRPSSSEPSHLKPAPTPTSARSGAPQAPRPDVQPLEFEAEEHLARGDAARALVLASSALRQRPESLILRGLVERARKAVLRGRRGERLDQRLREAHDLLERGDLRSAEAIATSALKLVPNHVQALALFSRIKERRLAIDSVEAEVERELLRLAAAQARQAVSRARSLQAEGNERGAFVAVRRGLRHVPDDPELLSLFGELQQGLLRATEAHAALRERVEQARSELAAGRITESRNTLRAALRDDPDFAPAQVLMQEVRAAFLARDAPVPTEQPAPAALAPQGPARPVSQVLWASRGPSSGPRSLAALQLIRAQRRRRVILTFALVVFVASLGAALFWAVREYQPASADDPLRGQPSELRRAVAATLAGYRSALEARDSAALARARPDVLEGTRDVLLADLAESGAVGVELRVVRVEANAQRARVLIQRTPVVAESPRAALPPSEETLRFVRRGDAWLLR